MAVTSSPMKPTDPDLCGAPMGVRTWSTPASKLRFCTRRAADCPYESHQRHRSARQEPESELGPLV